MDCVALALALGLYHGLAAQEPVTLRVGVALPEASQSQMNRWAEWLSSEWLVALGNDGRGEPRLADSWTRSPDGRDWTFQLNPRATFHDGRPADAQNVSVLVKKSMTDPVLLRVHPQLREIYDVVPAGPRSLTLRSRSARALMLDDLADLTLKSDGLDGGLGPFVAVSASRRRLELHAFEKHFSGQPQIKRVSFRAHRSLRNAWAGMLRGDADVLYEISRDAIEFVERDTRVRVYPFLRPYVSVVVFNVERPQFRDSAVRRALASGVDRDAILRSAYRGRGRIADGPLWPDHWTLTSDLPRLRYAPASATETLSRLEPSASGGGMPARVRFRCLVATSLESQPFERLALLLQRQLYDLGVDMQLEAVTLPELSARLERGDFDAALIEVLARTPSWIYGMWHSPVAGAPSFLKSGYRAADGELDAMQVAADDAELKRAIAAVYRKMYQDPPAIFIAWPETARAVTTDFEVPVEKGTDPLGANLRLWRPAGSSGATR